MSTAHADPSVKSGWAARVGNPCGCSQPRYLVASRISCEACGWEIEPYGFERNGLSLAKRDDGEALSDDESLQLGFVHEGDLAAMRDYAGAMDQDARRVESEIETYGVAPVVNFYAALGQIDHYRRLGVTFRPATPCGGRHRRASGARSTRRRGSRRGSRASPDDDGESEPPGLGLWRHPHFGSRSPGLPADASEACGSRRALPRGNAVRTRCAAINCIERGTRVLDGIRRYLSTEAGS